MMDVSKNTLGIYNDSSKEKYHSNKSREFILKIYEEISKNSGIYDRDVIKNIIEPYTEKGNRLKNRWLYSEISKFIFDIGPQESKLDNMLYNCNKLLDDSELEDECKYIILKLYDHINLAMFQVKKINTDADKKIEEIDKRIKEDLKGIERDYVTILGIFSGIVLAFVSGSIITSAVLQHINAISIYRLLGMTILLGYIWIEAINILFNYIIKINNKEISIKSIWCIRILFGILLIINFTVWLYIKHS